MGSTGSGSGGWLGQIRICVPVSFREPGVHTSVNAARTSACATVDQLQTFDMGDFSTMATELRIVSTTTSSPSDELIMRS